MRDFRDAKAMATTLRHELRDRNIQLSRADCLELISKALGEADWNTLSARIKAQESRRDCTQQTWRELIEPIYDRHLTPEERLGPWASLFAEARALHGTGTDPNSDEVLDLARRWIALSRVVTGGDSELVAKYSAAYKDALHDRQVAPKLPVSGELLRWLGPALTRAKSELAQS